MVPTRLNKSHSFKFFLIYGPFLASFWLFSSFLQLFQQLRDNMFVLNFADDWIRTAKIWYWTRRSANWATTTALVLKFVIELFLLIVPFPASFFFISVISIHFIVHVKFVGDDSNCGPLLYQLSHNHCPITNKQREDWAQITYSWI